MERRRQETQPGPFEEFLEPSASEVPYPRGGQNDFGPMLFENAQQRLHCSGMKDALVHVRRGMRQQQVAATVHIVDTNDVVDVQEQQRALVARRARFGRRQQVAVVGDAPSLLPKLHGSSLGSAYKHQRYSRLHILGSSMNTEALVILKKEEVCIRLQISPRTLDALVARQALPPGIKRGKYSTWSKSVIDTYERNQYVAQESWRPGFSL